MISVKIVAIAVSVLVVEGTAAALVFWPSDDDGPGEGRIVVTDDRGKTITFENPPERIMSLGSSFTDTLAMLGCMDNIFAVDQSSVNRLGSEYPELSSKEILPGKPDASTADLALQYGIDCIIVWNFSTYAEGMDVIEGIGIKVIALYPTDIGSVKTVISTLGKLMDKDVTASELVDDIDTTIENIAALATAKAGASYGDYKRVYIELDSATYMTSPPKGSIKGSMLDILGVNYIGRSETTPIVYDIEDIKLVFQPDIVIFMGPVNETSEKMKRIDDLNIPGAIVDVYHDGNGFNGNWASATPSFIKGLVYLYELIYAEPYIS